MKAMVMLPTYNERENIDLIINKLLGIVNDPAFQQTGFTDIQVLVVDDDSADGTGRIAEEMAKRHPGRVHVIHRMQRGRGTAGLDGLLYARQQEITCVIEMDADFSHDPDLIIRFLETIKENEIVIGSRYVRGGKTDQSLSRKLLSKAASIYLQLLLGPWIKDWQSGFRCFRREALLPLDLKGMALQRFSREYAIGIGVLYQLVKSGHTFREIPIEFTDRKKGQSKLSLRTILSYMGIALVLHFSKENKIKPVTDTLPQEGN
jgi:dolichol-phosphate mannosyltransferase